MDIKGGVAIVTGSSSGIGAACVRLLASKGCNVVINYSRSVDAARAVAADCEKAGAETLLVRADVGQDADCRRMVDETMARWGRIDALVNNAGITGPRCRIENVTADLLRDVTATNLIGPILCAREAVRHMAAMGGGSIVNLSSTATKRGSPDQWVHYAATKGAIDVLTAGLAAEVAAQGIRVNAVAPGLTLSDPADAGRIVARLDTMRGEIPMNRAGTAGEVAEAVFWLCSDAASYVTGVVLPVAGGR
jgi:NAD(P)-dependent dehydrogenase (short-subunit alcohol dehydrogenase family)